MVLIIHIKSTFQKKETKQETLEEIKVIKRTELYNSILSIVKQIPRKEVDEDAVDAPSCAYELEQLFLKWQQERSYSENDMIMFADFFYNYKELLKREKWEILEMSKEDIFKKWIEKVKKK